MRTDKIRLIFILLVLFVSVFFMLWPPVPNAKSFGQYLFGNIKLGLDIKGGSRLDYVMTGSKPTQELTSQVITVLRRRLDDANFTEAIVSAVGDNGIRVEIPGIGDPKKAEKLIGQKAQLYFGQVLDHVTSSVKPAPKIGLSYAGAVWLRSKNATDDWYLVNKNIQVGAGSLRLSGNEVKNAAAAVDTQRGGWRIDLTFDSKGANDFFQITQALVGKPLAIVMDEFVLSAPVVQTAIQGGRAEITGTFTYDEAQELAALIRSGNLPVSLKLSEEQTLGPTLGADVIRRSLIVGLLGILLVMIYMLIYYKGMMGLVAVLALFYNAFFIFGMLALTHGILTLPGIAGIILTVGTTVDGNVIIFERIKEEMRTGKTVRASIANGFNKSVAVILDANITSLLTAFVLYYFGIGSIKGFAVTLTIGILGAMFTSLVFSRYLLDLMAPLIKNKYATIADQPESIKGGRNR